MKWLFQKPRRLIGCVFLAAIPLALAKDVIKADKLVRGKGTSVPVTLHLDGLGPTEMKEISVFRIGLRDNPGKIKPRRNSTVWTVDEGWLTRLEIEAPEDVWQRVTSATLEIGARSWAFDRGELMSRWTTVPVAGDGAADRIDGRVRRLRSPPDLRAETSRLSRFQPYMNWQGDGALIIRFLRPFANIVTLAFLALIFFRFPRRLPWAVRRCRVILCSVLRRSRSGDVQSAFHAVSWNLAGLVAVAAAFAFLQWQSPYYFVQDDVLVAEFPGILVGCRGVWEGHLPEWNPYTGLGSPLMSEGLYSLTYPPLYVSYAIARHCLGDEYSTMEVFALTHLLAGFWLCKRVCLKIGCGQAAGMLASLSFVLSGPVLILGRCWHMFIPLAVWIPAIALCIESLRTKPVGWRWLGLSAICLAMPVHVGFPQLAVACFGMFCILTLSLLVAGGIDWNAGCRAVAAVLLGLALSSPLLLCQKEHGKHVQKLATSDGSATPGVAAMFLPAPIVTAEPPFWSDRPDMTHLYFFGGVLGWCWVAGCLLTRPESFTSWSRAPRLWWSAGLAFFLLALGDATGLWPAIGVLPVLSTLARVPLRVLPFFVFCAVVSGGWIFDKLWSYPRRNCRVALISIALGTLAYHLMRVDSAMTYRLFRPYPKIAGTPVERLQAPNTIAARRVCSFEDRLSPRSAHGLSLADSMAGIYSIYAVETYDPPAEKSPAYVSALKEIVGKRLRGLQAFGVHWVLVDRADLTASPAGELARRTAYGDKDLDDVDIVCLPWIKFPISELEETLAEFHGCTVPAWLWETFESFEISGSSPLVFRKSDPNVGLSFQAHTEGVDVDLAGAAGGNVVVNFLRLDWMTAAVDGAPVSCDADEWGRMVVEVPRGAKQLAIRYQPPWKLGGLVGVVIGITAVGTFLVARHHSTRLVLLSRSPTGRDDCNDV